MHGWSSELARALAPLALLLIACGGRPASTITSHEATAEDPKYEACELVTQTGTLEAECGTLVVPEDRGAPEGARLRLPMQRKRATERAGGVPLFYLGDGPGVSNFQLWVPASLARGHDLVIVGYRGADGSRVLDCPEIGEALGAAPALSTAWLDAMATQLDACLGRYARDGVALGSYGLRDLAADLERARELLGYDRIHLLAEGFGALVAQAYATTFPERTERLVLLMPTPREDVLPPPGTAAAALRRYGELCRQSDACELPGPNLETVIDEVAGALPERWLIFPIERGRLILATSLSLPYRRAAQLAIGAWLGAAGGDFSGLGQLAWSGGAMLQSATVWGQATLALASALDLRGRDVGAELAARERVVGAPVVQIVAAALQRGLAAAPRFEPLVPAEQRLSAPTLVVSGSLDPRASAEAVRERLLPRFEQAQQLVAEEIGSAQDLWGEQPQEMEQLVTRFLEGAPLGGLRRVPLSFELGVELTGMAKIVVALLVAIPVIAVALVLLLLRRLRRAVRAEATQKPRG